MTDFPALLATLDKHKVAFILIGGAAAIAHGSARLTQDLDIVYQRSPDNLKRLVAAFAGYVLTYAAFRQASLSSGAKPLWRAD